MNLKSVSAYRFLFALALISISYLALAESQEMPFNLWDKASHTLAFITLAFFADRSFPENSRRINPVKLWGLFSYGIVIELLQSLLPYRHASGWDVLANATGLLTYALSYRVFSIQQNHK